MIDQSLSVGRTTSTVNRQDEETAFTANSCARKLNVLVVDDDLLVLQIGNLMLEDLGHEVLRASSVQEALDQTRTRIDIDIVVSGLTMPGISGLQLRDILSVERPELPFLLCTAFAGICEVRDMTVACLGKPFSQRQLADAINGLVFETEIAA